MSHDDDVLRGWLRLARCHAVAPRDRPKLVELVGGIAALAGPTVRDLAFKGVPQAAVAALSDQNLSARLEDELAFARDRGWSTLHPDHPFYPPPLREILVPPPILHAKGDLASLRTTTVAIVGTRRPTSYGISMARSLSAGLAARGYAIASGLARGIDTQVHDAALDAGGITVAVLGCGLDVDYPAENAELARRIETKGALLSEFPPGTPPLGPHFPQRNRIISGISDAVVIVEAALPSGSLVTAHWAEEQDRTVLAVPGRHGDRMAAGTLWLLRDGAPMACEPKDVIDEILEERRPEPSEFLGSHPDGVETAAATLTGVERRLLESIPARDDVRVDDLIASLGIAAEKVLALLLGLEMTGLIESLPGSRVRRASRRPRSK